MARTAPGLAAVVLALLLAAPASAAHVDGSCTVKRDGKAACAKTPKRKKVAGTHDGGPGDPVLRPVSARDEKRRVPAF